MNRQFNWLFPTKKQLPHTTKTMISSQVFSPTQTCKPYFGNFDFVARLSISKTRRQLTSRSSLLTRQCLQKPAFPKQTTQKCDRIFVDKCFILRNTTFRFGIKTQKL